MKKILLPALGMTLLLASCTQPAEKEAVFTPPTIVNDTSTVIMTKNLQMEVRSVSGQTVIDVEKDGVKERVTMADWEANTAMYEKKYGKLPPPPPPSPENVEFTPPKIVKDENIKMNVRYRNGQTTIEVEKNGVKESVKMADWEANKKMYEEKYGVLPPPPPPPPPAAPKPPPPPPPPPVKS